MNDNILKTSLLASFAGLCLISTSSAQNLLSPSDQIIGGVLNDTNFVEGMPGFMECPGERFTDEAQPYE